MTGLTTVCFLFRPGLTADCKYKVMTGLTHVNFSHAGADNRMQILLYDGAHNRLLFYAGAAGRLLVLLHDGAGNRLQSLYAGLTAGNIYYFMTGLTTVCASYPTADFAERCRVPIPFTQRLPLMPFLSFPYIDPRREMPVHS